MNVSPSVLVLMFAAWLAVAAEALSPGLCLRVARFDLDQLKFEGVALLLPTLAIQSAFARVEIRTAKVDAVDQGSNIVMIDSIPKPLFPAAGNAP